MQTKTKTKQISLAALIFLCLAAMAVFLIFGNVPLSAKAVESGSFIDYTADPDVKIALDVNGEVGGRESQSLSENPAKPARQRTITVDLLNNKSGNEKLYSDNDIYNYTTDYFTVEGVRTSGSSTIASIKITAIKPTAALGVKPRFVLVLWTTEPTQSGATEKKITVEVTVTAKQPAQVNSGSTLYVGRSNATGASGETFPLELTNYTKTEIDLANVLVNRVLYRNKPDVKTHDVTDDTTTNAEKSGVLLGTQKEYLVFNDLSEYTITKATIAGGVDAVLGVEMYQTGAGAHNTKFVLSVNIAPADVARIQQLSGINAFWADEDNRFFELEITLFNSSSTDKHSVIVCVPVVFEPAAKPSIRSEFGMTQVLNVSAKESEESGNVTGVRSVRVYPSDLCYFPAYDYQSMIFLGTEIPQHDSNILDIASGTDESGKVYYEVTGKTNGRQNIEFTLYYTRKSDISRVPFTVPVSFTVYGNYGVTLYVNGTKAHNFTIRSAAFAALENDGYQIVDARVANVAGDTNSYVAFQYSDGTLTLRPQRSVNTGYVAAYVSLVNMQGRRIEIVCPIQIDMKAGDLFSTWRTWQIILFWVGIGLAAALLILLIVWLFIRSVHRHKLDELETTAPTSAYIIKLNSTIAAAQAQQRLATQGYGGAAPGQMLQLGAGPTASAAPDPNTLALGVTPQMSTPAYSTGTTMAPPPPMPQTTTLPPLNDEIYIPISDEELLIRIYEEKFEPRGMLKRTFDKSKDLQQRELEREKERIREDVRNGMSIEEACKSLRQREAEAAGFTATGMGTTTGTMGTTGAMSQPVQLDPLIAVLGFDPADPIIADVKREEPQEDWSEEEKKLKEAEYNNLRLRSELSIIETRIEAIVAATEKTEAEVADANASVEALTSGIKEAEQKLDDKNTDLAVERRKSAKEALGKEIAELEDRIHADKEAVAGKKSDIEFGSGLLARIKEIFDEYADKKEATDALVATSDQELDTARAAAQHAADLAAQAKKQAELNIKLETLNPLMHTVNVLDGEIKVLVAKIENATGEKDSRKTRVAALQNELLSTTDASKINDISNAIRDLNKEISDLDRGATSNTTLKSNKGIEMSSARRKANEFIDKEQIELEDVITAEDAIIAAIAHEKLMQEVEAEKTRAEEEVARCQSVCDLMTSELDSGVMTAVADVADRVKAAEEALAAAQATLAETDAAIEAATDDDAKLEHTMQQMAQQEEVSRLTEELEAVRAEGIKANLEFRTKGEEELENARAELARATEDFNRATERYHEVSTMVNPLDLITSGSGVISQDRKKIEAENLKKILAEQQSALEQAKLQAQLAQQEAEKAVADAQRASEESRAEAERLAQEALQKAEEAQKEAERRSQEDAERMREEAERVKLQAQEEIERAKQEAEEARRLAEEEAEKARQEALEEAERAKQEAQEEAERAKQEAQEEAERAKQQAQEEAERARKEAEEEAEKARLAAEAEAERVRQETEESKRQAEEEAEKARIAAEEEARKQEEEAKKLAEEEAARKARIEEKVAKRKAEISALRAELKNVTEEEQGQTLREKFYAIQLALDEDEKTSTELNDLLAKSMDDASHAAELSRYKKLASQKPRRIVKKVTERVNRIPRKKAGARPGARPTRPGARPAARPGTRSAARPGARPAARPGARPTRPGARPTGAAPRGTRPTRPSGTPGRKN